MDPYFKYIDIPNLSTIQQQVYQHYVDIMNEKPPVPGDRTDYAKTTVDDATSPRAPTVNNFSLILVKTESVYRYSPALEEYLHSVNLKCELNRIVLITTSGNTTATLHSDGFYCANSINLPIYNCENGYTEFFEDDDKMYEPIGDYRRVENAPSEVVATASANRPQWFNNFKIHRAINKSPNPRYTMSLRFDPPKYIQPRRGPWVSELHARTKIID